MKLDFTPATDGDIDALLRFNKELIDQYEDVRTIDYEKVLDWCERKIRTCIHEYTCIRCDGEKAGYYRFHSEDGKMELDDLYIFPAYRSKGIGTAVLQKCIQATDFPIFLYVFSGNTGAIHLYERLNFRVVQTVSKTRVIMEHKP